MHVALQKRLFKLAHTFIKCKADVNAVAGDEEDIMPLNLLHKMMLKPEVLNNEEVKVEVEALIEKMINRGAKSTWRTSVNSSLASTKDKNLSINSLKLNYT